MNCCYIYYSYICSMPIFDVRSLTVRKGGKVIIDNLSFTVNKGKHLAITGPSGSGKTTLMNALSGSHSYEGSIITSSEGRNEKIVLVEQQHRFKNLSNTSNFYYQQRFNSNDSEDAITVEEALLNTVAVTVRSDHSKQIDDVVDLLKIQHLLSTRLIQLSNGENKRLQIAKALLAQPTVLMLDNPFIGLDAAARETLHAVLEEMSRRSIHIILVTAYHQVPGFITHVIDLGKEKNVLPEDIYTFRQRQSNTQQAAFTINKSLLKKLNADAHPTTFEFAVRMKNVSVQYNNRPILNKINWEVRNGERWSLSGPNGSGKSTLLSLINADNPQAYSNEIYLFDRRRGSGESIWDIKKKIGFVSPELHLFFEGSNNCFEVIASGLFDTIGLFRMVNDEQTRLIMDWMELLNISHVKLKPLFQLSNSQQRLVLLARALVKNPPLLILDEPCQGLDDDQIAFFKDIVNDICLETGKTLIYVSHYPHEIPSCVDKFLMLEEGVQRSVLNTGAGLAPAQSGI